MGENWIDVAMDNGKCKMTFLDSCHILLDEEDMKYLINELIHCLLLEKVEVSDYGRV